MAHKEAKHRGVVYVLHFSRPYKGKSHYVGWVKNYEDLGRRIEQHRRGRGANFLRHVVAAGIELDLVLTFEGSENTERRFKQLKSTPKYCQMCCDKKGTKCRTYGAQPKRKSDLEVMERYWARLAKQGKKVPQWTAIRGSKNLKL